MKLQETLTLHVSEETVRKAVLELGYVYKKKSLHASEQSRAIFRKRGKTGVEHMQENDAEHLVFLDESGVNTNLTRHYARSKKNERAVDSTPINTPCNTTILSSVRL